MFTSNLLKKLFLLLFVIGILFQPLLPLVQFRQVVADDEFEPWCGSNCEDADDDDDDDNGCEGDDSSCNNDCSASAGGAINLFTGEESLNEVDVYLPGYVALLLVRTYRSQSAINQRYGYGWDFNINQRMQKQADGSAVLNNGACGRYIFEFKNGVYQSPRGLFLTLTEATDGSFTLTQQDGVSRLFDTDGKLTVIRDRFNNQVTLTYDARGRMPIIGLSPFSRSQQRGVIAYDFQLTGITDSVGRATTFTYNTDGRLVEIGYAGTRRIQYEYDANDNLTVVINELDQRTEYRYQDSSDPNNLTTIVDHEGRTQITRSYDGKDRMTRETVDGSTSTIAYTESESGLIRQTVFTDGRGDRTTYTFDEQGNTTRVSTQSSRTNGNNDVTRTLTYNNQNQVTNLAVAPGTSSATWRETVNYDSNGRLTAASTSDGQRFQAASDGANYYQPTTLTNLGGGSLQFTYDARNNLQEVTLPEGQKYGFQWTTQGQLQNETDPLGRTIGYTYDSSGNLITLVNAAGLQTMMAYDAAGNVTSITDALSHQLGMTYDNYGQLTAIQDALGSSHNYTYDSQGNLVEYRDPNNNATRMTYSPGGFMLSSTDALGQTTAYTYDGAFNLSSVTDANNVVTRFSYDAFGQLTGIQYADGTSASYRYDHLDNLVEASSPQLRLSYDYTNGLRGFPSQLTYLGQNGNPVDATLTYDYLIPGTTPGQGSRWRSGLLYGLEVQTAGRQVLAVDYAYNPLMQMTAIISVGAANYRYELAYDAVSRLRQMGPATNNPGVQTAIAYDSLDRVTNWTNRSADGSRELQNYTYTYDDVGNVTGITDSIAAETTTYSYDASYQLTGAELPGSVVLEYTYDPAGNRTSAERNDVTTTYQYDAANQLISSTANGGTTYTYDQNGNLLTRADSAGTVRYSWNADNDLTRIDFPDNTFIAYEYDAIGRRLSKLDRSGALTYYVYDGFNLVQEMDADGAVKATYIHGQMIDHPISMTRGGNVYYFLYDQLGSVLGLADATGTVVTAYRYDPWGNIITTTGSTVENPFRFTGREWDADADLYYYRTRYYDPSVGRFISRDKIGLVGGWNLYIYVDNKPIQLIDPNGLDWRLPGWIEDIDLSGVANFAAGFGDKVSFGLTTKFNEWTGADQVVNKCSSAYRVGSVLGEINRDFILGRTGLRVLGGLSSKTKLGHWLNHGRWWRLGPGRMPANGRWPSGTHVPRMSLGPQRPGFKNPHFDLRFPWFD